MERNHPPTVAPPADGSAAASGREFNAAECYTFGLFVFSELAIVGSVLLLVARMTGLGVSAWWPLSMAGLYTVWALSGLYADRRPWTLLRGTIVFAFVIGALAALLYGLQWYRFSGLG